MKKAFDSIVFIAVVLFGSSYAGTAEAITTPFPHQSSYIWVGKEVGQNRHLVIFMRYDDGLCEVQQVFGAQYTSNIVIDGGTQADWLMEMRFAADLCGHTIEPPVTNGFYTVLRGHGGPDVLVGGINTNADLIGGDGNDTFYPGGGSISRSYGQQGTDTFFGYFGDDSGELYGGDGNNLFVVSALSNESSKVTFPEEAGKR